MQQRSFTSPGLCWIADGPRGLGRNGMKKLRAARKDGMLVSAFIQELAAKHAPQAQEAVEEPPELETVEAEGPELVFEQELIDNGFHFTKLRHAA